MGWWLIESSPNNKWDGEAICQRCGRKFKDVPPVFMDIGIAFAKQKTNGQRNRYCIDCADEMSLASIRDAFAKAWEMWGANPNG